MASLRTRLRQARRFLWSDFTRDRFQGLGWVLVVGPWAELAFNAIFDLYPGAPPLSSREALARLGLSAAGLLLIRVTRQPRPRSEAHQVTLNHVAAPDVPSYYVAICDCGWGGEAHPTPDEARKEGAEHSPRVRPGVDEPLKDLPSPSAQGARPSR